MLLKTSSEYDALNNLFDFYFDRLNQGKLMVITGNPITQMGNGKTSLACSMGYAIDKRFSEKNIEFKLAPFLGLVNDIRESKRIHSVAICDEAQTSIPSDEWYTASSKAMFQVATVFRKCRSMALFLTPNFNFLLKKIRYLIDYWAFPEIDYNHDTQAIEGTFRFYKLHKNVFTEKIYPTRLTFYDEEEDAQIRVDEFKYKLPPKELMDKIVEKEDLAKGGIHEDAMATAYAFDNKSESKPEDRFKNASSLPEVNLMLQREGKVSGSLINILYPQISRAEAANVASMINTKKKIEDLKNETRRNETS